MRAFVAVFLGAFAICGLFGLEAWPLTGWRLFSQLRTDHQVAWQAVAVAAGREEQIRFERLPRGYRNFPLVMRMFSALPPAERAAACRVWLDAAKREVPGTDTVRIYRIDWYFSHRRGPRDGPPPASSLVLTCHAEGVSHAPA